MSDAKSTALARQTREQSKCDLAGVIHFCPLQNALAAIIISQLGTRVMIMVLEEEWNFFLGGGSRETLFLSALIADVKHGVHFHEQVSAEAVSEARGIDQRHWR